MPTLPTPGGDDGTWGTELNTFLQVVHDAGGDIPRLVAAEADIEDALAQVVNPHVVWNINPVLSAVSAALTANSLYLLRLERQPVARTITGIVVFASTQAAGNFAASLYTTPATDLSTLALLDAATFTEVASGSPVANPASGTRLVVPFSGNYEWAANTDIWIGIGSDAAESLYRFASAAFLSRFSASSFSKATQYSTGLPATVTGAFADGANAWIAGAVTTNPGP